MKTADIRPHVFLVSFHLHRQLHTDPQLRNEAASGFLLLVLSLPEDSFYTIKTHPALTVFRLPTVLPPVKTGPIYLRSFSLEILLCLLLHISTHRSDSHNFFGASMVLDIPLIHSFHLYCLPISSLTVSCSYTPF